MAPLATLGNLVEVTPWDDLQFWADAKADWVMVDDRTPFRFRVEGELRNAGAFFGLYGQVVGGPDRYLKLICSIVLRHDHSDWQVSDECCAGFIVGPSVVRRDLGYDPAKRADMRFYLHPEALMVDGFPRMSRFGGVRVIDESELK